MINCVPSLCCTYFKRRTVKRLFHNFCMVYNLINSTFFSKLYNLIIPIKHKCLNRRKHTQPAAPYSSSHSPSQFSQKLIKVSCILICFNFTLIIKFHYICFIFWFVRFLSLLLPISLCVNFKSYLPTLNLTILFCILPYFFFSPIS